MRRPTLSTPRSGPRALALIPALALLVACGCGSETSADGGSGGGWSKSSSQAGGGMYSEGGVGSSGGSSSGGTSSGGGADAGSSTYGDASAASDAGATAGPNEPGEEDKGSPGEADIPKSLPFVLAGAEPRSTFAADVDTASFDIFLQQMGYGTLPHPSTVRLEEYVNAFEYGDARPQPEGDVPFAVSFETALSPFDKGVQLVRIGLAGREVPKSEKKAANLVFLIDVSGSMQSSSKLPLVKKVVSTALNELDPSDKVSLVTYAGKVGVKLPPTAASSKSVILKALDNLKAGGSTNGAGGIQLAYQQAEKGFIKGGINHVVLCTDGDFNVGVSSTKGLVDLIEAKRKTGITLTALGFGSYVNDAMLESVSNAGNGIYAVIQNLKHAIDYGKNQLLQTIQHIAQDVKIQVQFNPTHVKAWRLLGYANRQLTAQQFEEKETDAGEIGSGHKVTAIYEVVLAKADIPSPKGAPALVTAALPGAVTATLDVKEGDLALVKVRYKAPGAKASDPSMEVQAALSAEWKPGKLSEASKDLRWAAGLAALAEKLAGSPFRDITDMPLAKSLMADALDERPDRKDAWPLINKAFSQL